MAWHLIKRAFDWTGDNPQYEQILDWTPQEIISDMKCSWSRLERKLKSKLPPLLNEGRLGLATAYQKYGKPEPKKRPVIDLKFDPTINIRKAAARAGIFCLNNIIGHGSFHLPNSTRLRQMLDTIQSKLEQVAKQNRLNDPVLVLMSDDIEITLIDNLGWWWYITHARNTKDGYKLLFDLIHTSTGERIPLPKKRIISSRSSSMKSRTRLAASV
jgi:hypothetical protein